MRCERGQATVEWVGLVLLASLVLAAVAVAAPVAGGRSLARVLSDRIVCGGCERPSANADSTAATRAGPLTMRLAAARLGCMPVHTVEPGPTLCQAKEVAKRLRPGAEFLKDRVTGCLIGAAGAKVFKPFAEEVLSKESARSPKSALRALKRGLRRAKHEVLRGKGRAGVVGCVSGALGL